MIIIAGAGVACALLRPFAASPPSSGEVIGMGFDLQETRLLDGRVVTGLAPRVTMTKQAPRPRASRMNRIPAVSGGVERV
jgi:hypothetical protein